MSKRGSPPPVPRDGAGNRLHGVEDICLTNPIRGMHAAGLTLSQRKRYFSMNGTDDDVLRGRRDILLNTQENLVTQLNEIKRCMSYLKK